jgi:hypothetical protein
MAKHRVGGTVKIPKSNVEIMRDRASKKHAKHPERIEQINRMVWEFQKREQSSEILDLGAALQQLGRELDSIGAPTPRLPKDPGPKTDPIVKTVARLRVAGHTKKRRVGEKSTSGKRQTSKRTYVK